jgi:hypothetical protein
MKVFDTFERTYQAPALHTEGHFSFFNRSARPAVSRIRSTIEAWFAQYPTNSQSELRARLRDDFDSAFFELLLHELFRRLGASLVLHPQVGTKHRRPDFGVTLRAQLPFILEATLCKDDNDDSHAQENRLAGLYDAINTLRLPAFNVRIDDVKEGANPVSMNRVKAFLQRQLHSLDHEIVLSEYERSSVLPGLVFEANDWRIAFTILPKHRDRLQRAEPRLIGMYPVLSRCGDSTNALRKALAAKAKRYGQLDLPYLIAVNTVSPWGVDRAAERDALFGTLQHYVSGRTREWSVKNLRDGFWGTAGKPKNTRVSGVLFGAAFATNVPRIEFVLYRNPRARRDLPCFDWPFNEAACNNGALTYSKAKRRLADVFELPNKWPGNLFR